jgi:spore coat protein U-like protein
MLVITGAAGVQAKSCTVSGGGVNFGVYDPLSPGSLDVTGSLTLDCTGSVHAVLSVSTGAGTGASFSSGRVMMRSPAPGKLTYNLYTDAARTRVLGDGTRGSRTLNVSGWNTVDIPIYARMPGRQASTAPGSYLDVVVVTVSY